VYESFFGLRAKPFQLNPDPDFFFGSRGHRRAMAYLEYGLHQGEGFIVVTGEVGAGKTTLLRGLLRKIPPDRIQAAQIVSTQVEADDLLRLVADAFGLPTRGVDKASLLSGLQAHVRGLHEDGRRALLIVDEAQNLSPRAVEELRMLSNFQIDDRSPLQSFLVGQPEFRAIMQRPEMRQLRQRVIASYHLGPLDRDETRHYVEHRLRHVGWRDDPRFDPAAFDAIHATTEGVPRRINSVCDRLLLATYLAEQHAITERDVHAVASELETELGASSIPAVEAPATSAEVLPLARTRAAAGTAAAPSVAAQPSPETDRLDELESRVAALETSSTMMLNLLKNLLRSLRGAPRDASSGS
jgi:putative secretion ATPase (PEP-CTERM system associated)